MAGRARSQPETRDWKHFRAMWVRVLETQTGEGLDVWLPRIARARPPDAEALRTWLASRGVTGYARQLLVMEHFGYPDFVAASATQLIDGQYADRPHLRPIYDAVVEAAEAVGEIVIQARKSYVSILTPRRTFARVQATTMSRVDLGLRLDTTAPVGRLAPSRLHPTMRLQIGLSTPSDLDAEARRWLRAAYEENA
jgi:Domain of unknown function (DUF5655)